MRPLVSCPCGPSVFADRSLQSGRPRFRDSEVIAGALAGGGTSSSDRGRQQGVVKVHATDGRSSKGDARAHQHGSRTFPG